MAKNANLCGLMQRRMHYKENLAIFATIWILRCFTHKVCRRFLADIVERTSAYGHRQI